jgi:hypothetical protein
VEGTSACPFCVQSRPAPRHLDGSTSVVLLATTSTIICSSNMAQADPQLVVVATASKLLARAVTACLASDTAPEERTVVLELHQGLSSLGALALRGDGGIAVAAGPNNLVLCSSAGHLPVAVCDDGVPLSAEQGPLEAFAAQLQPQLAHPLFAGNEALIQTTGEQPSSLCCQVSTSDKHVCLFSPVHVTLCNMRGHYCTMLQAGTRRWCAATASVPPQAAPQLECRAQQPSPSRRAATCEAA